MSTFKQVADSFDWNYSDLARLETYKHRRGQTLAVTRISDGCLALRYALFECLAGQGERFEHPVYDLYTLEAELDLGATILLAFGGYYKQAGICLRSFLELAFLAMYYADHRETYNQWKKGQARSPPFHGKGHDNALGYLFTQTTLKNYPCLKKEASDLYRELNTFVHTSAMEVLDLWKGRDNVPRFLPHSFSLWGAYLVRVHTVTALSLMLAYWNDVQGYFRTDKEAWRDLVVSIGRRRLLSFGIKSP